MKKLRYLAVLIIVAIAGFALGRATGTSGVPSIANIHRDFPLFPAPPKPSPAAPKIEAPVKIESDIVLEEPPDGMRPEGVTFQVSGRAKAGGFAAEGRRNQRQRKQPSAHPSPAAHAHG